MVVSSCRCYKNEEEILNSADKTSDHRTIMTFINLCSWYTLMISKWALVTERKLPQKTKKEILFCFNYEMFSIKSMEDVALGNSFFTIYSSFSTRKIYKNMKVLWKNTQCYQYFRKYVETELNKLSQTISASPNLLYLRHKW